MHGLHKGTIVGTQILPRTFLALGRQSIWNFERKFFGLF